MRTTPWDLRLFARTVALTGVGLVIVAIVEAITDERGLATAGTGGRSLGVLPLLPVAAAAAVLVTLAPAANAGELRALGALGCSPWRARLGPLVAAFALSLLSAVGIASGRDVSAMFPPPIPAGDVRVEMTADGPTFVSPRRRIRVVSTPPNGMGGDVLERTGPPPGSDAVAASDRRQALGAASAIALAGLALAVWAAAPHRRGAIGTLLTLTAWSVSEVLVFQAAGARTVSPFVTGAPSLALLGLVLVEDRLRRRLARDEAWI